MEIILIRLIEALLMPPGLMILMMLLGTVIIGRLFITGKLLIIGGFVLLVLSSLPIASQSLLGVLEQTPPLTANQIQQPRFQAIVVLGGGRYADAPEYGQDTVSAATLERLRYGAALQRQTQRPLLVTGGKHSGDTISEAELMQRVMEKEFRVPVKWVEGRSANTWENARYSYQSLQQAGITRIALVTHAWHMPRSIEVFEQNGFVVTPAPTAYTTSSGPLLLELVPSANAMHQTRIALHELLGRLWYGVRY